MEKNIKKQNQSGEISKLFTEVRELILSARKNIIRNVNIIQIITNYEIGRRIVEVEQKGENRAEYGKAILKDLSSRLTKEFGRGFSERNLDYMRKFYLLYGDRLAKISQMASAKLIKVQKDQIVSDKSRIAGIFEISQMPFGKLNKPAFSLSWSQYVFLIGIKDDGARSFYEIEAANNSWTLPELKRQFRTL